MTNEYISLLSQAYRFLVYSFTKTKMRLETGMFIISVDIDVGDSKLGIINKGKNDLNISHRFSEYLVGKIEKLAFPIFADLFNHLEIPVTFAVRGQLAEVDNSILMYLVKSPVKHDVSAHGYYHKAFKNLCRNEAETELKMISVGMRKLGIIPKSFVFPRNSVAHLGLLEEYGYKCYRGYKRCMYIEKKDGLYNVHPSLFVDQNGKLKIMKKILDICITRKLPFHIWFHLWNFGRTSKSIQKNLNRWFVPFLEYAREKEKKGILTFETMLSATEKVDETFHSVM